MEAVNGKRYPVWGALVDQKAAFVGATMEDWDADGPNPVPMVTKVVDIRLEPNGEEHAFFSVVGEDFTCGFSTEVGGVTGGDPGWLTFMGYRGHLWRIENRSSERLHNRNENRERGGE